MNLFNKKPSLSKSEITQADLSYWRAQHPDGIYQVVVNGKEGYFRNLRKKELLKNLDKFCKQAVGKEGKVKEAEIFLANLIELSWLGGDIELMTIEPYKAEVFKKVGEGIISRIKTYLPNLSRLIS